MKKIEYGFRITHINNIPYIDKTGFVLADSQLASENYIAIGDTNVIDKRKVRINGINLTKYIPFYFGPRSVMLYVIQNGYNGVKKQKAEDIVYCVIRISDIIAHNINCIFSDGHALNAITRFHTQEELPQLNNIISYNDVYAHYWVSEEDIDLKRRKEAELLIENELPREYIRGYIVYNKEAKERLAGYGISENRIVINSNYYF